MKSSFLIILSSLIFNIILLLETFLHRNDLIFYQFNFYELLLLILAVTSYFTAWITAAYKANLWLKGLNSCSNSC